MRADASTGPGSVLVHKVRAGADALLAACSRLGIRTETADRALRRLSGKDNCYAAAVFRKAAKDLDARGNHLRWSIPWTRNLGCICAPPWSWADIAWCPRGSYEPQWCAPAWARCSSCVWLNTIPFELPKSAGERQIYPLLSADARPLSEAAGSKSPHSLVFGNEGSGLPAEFERLGQPVMIEQSAAIDSYNLAIAAAIGMYAFKTN